VGGVNPVSSHTPEDHSLRAMTTPLQAARHARGWSQTRAAWELTRLAERRKVRVAEKASLKTLFSRWENGHATPDPFYQPLLCELYGAIPRELGFGTEHLPLDGITESDGKAELLTRSQWTRDDLHSLSASFDEAIARSSAADIELLAHEWLNAEPPQLMELEAGRHVSDELISTVEHRVIQLRRADDFISGRVSHTLVRDELKAATQLLEGAALTDIQSKRLLTATGELAQLAAWVAADAGLYREAATYAQGGILAAHGAGDQPLAAQIISTLSYQLANTGNPRQAALLARTAYAGARKTATATTKALLLERVAWGDAKSGDLTNAQRSLGIVEESFSQSRPEDDPDWVYWLDRDEINVMAGRCYTELKQARLAEPLLLNATNGYDDAKIRENSLYLSWLAEDYILLGEIDRAVEIAIHVLELANRANSVRTDDRLSHLARLLKRYKSVKSVGEFLERYIAV
jgi:transcriptional regulator with XRE-family HTH domain